MQLISYIATLPSKLLNGPHATDKKFLTLTTFPLGVTASGDAGTVETRMQYCSSDVAFMLGWVHEHGKRSPHLLFRKEILDKQTAIGGRTIIADSNLFLYKNTKNPSYYLRYSYDGVFPSTGEYCDQTPDPARWQKISQDIGLTLQPYRTQGTHILLCLQRNGGWSMAGFNVVDWALQTIAKIRKHSKRPIRIRPHPGDKGAARDCAEIVQRSMRKYVGISISQSETDLIGDLHDCWAVVNHNSSPAVGAAIEGIPVFVTDPAHSQCAEIANTDLANIEYPNLPDRQSWVERLSMFHWSHEELANGTAWNHMKKWAKP
jgi:hypothetical protein